MNIKGIAYYPEHWDKNEWDKDLKRIKAMGVNTIRIGEFMWAILEPKEGQFDFSLLDEMVEKITDHGFKILMGTPTATFPSWVVSNYDNILAVDAFGNKRKYGTRRQYCYNSKDYQRLSRIITEKMVERYSKYENIIGFQIDNELGHEGSDFCQCDNCKKGFRVFLKEKYKNIEKLNDTCGNVFWGQMFNAFEEIPVPFNDLLGHNPTLRLDYARFISTSLVNYANDMISIVKNNKANEQKVTTNLPGGLFNKWFDANDLVKNVDFVSFDNYPIWGGETNNANAPKVAMELDMIRGLKNQKFWIVEELIGAQGHDYVGWLPRPNQAKLWAMQAHLRGAENIFFFRYKGLNKGEEQFCQGIFDVDNRMNSKFDEVVDFFNDVGGEFETDTLTMNNEVAMVYDFENIWSWKIQLQSKTFDFPKEFLKHYKALYDLNINTDVISTDKSFDQYKLLVIPNMQVISDELLEKINAFISKGKQVIFGYRSGIRNKNNNMRLGINPLENLIGAEIEAYEALDQHSNVSVEYDGEEYKLDVWRDILKTTTGESIINYTDYGFVDNSCVIMNHYNNGQVYYFGASLPEELMNRLYKNVFTNTDIEFSITNDAVEMIKLQCDGKEKQFFLNHDFTKREGIEAISYIRR